MLAPSPRRLFLCFLFLSALVFLRPLETNFIFDEQEALLGNPYLDASSRWLDAFRVDFWGRAPTRTIGSYRPLPNLLWWPLRSTLAWNTPFVLCLLNLLVHAGTATLVALSVKRLVDSGEPECSPHIAPWAAGLWFTVSATSTEAVCNVVGMADLLVGLFSASQLLLLCAFAASDRRPRFGRVVAVVFATTFLGFLSKETMMASALWAPTVSFLVLRRGVRLRTRLGLAAVTMGAAVAALGGFVLVRANLFPAEPADVARFVHPESRGVLRTFFVWFGQPKMPVDPLNNPLLQASLDERLATSLRLAFDQARQIVFPIGLNADHSFPRETVTGWGLWAWLGGGLLFGALGMVGFGMWRARAPGGLRGPVLLVASGAAIFLGGYLPISNAFVLLPTIRADRLLYLPSVGSALILAGLVGSLPARRRLVLASCASFVVLHAIFARLHAFDYRDDLSFWRATSSGDPASAKSHLNFGVMVGARGNEPARLVHTKKAVELAPRWPMGRVYLGDVLCRLGDLDAAFLHYRMGFSQAPNSKALTALGLQCLWEEGGFARFRAELLALADEHPDTWLRFFVTELRSSGDEHGGIPVEYRPRKYNARAAVKSSPEPAPSR